MDNAPQVITEKPPQKVKRGSYKKREDVLPLIDPILDAIANGVPMRQACKDKDVAHSTFLKIVTDDKVLFDRYARARTAQASWLFDSIGTIEEDTLDGKIDPQVAKVVIDSRKWRLAKLHPKEYGDRSQVDMISSDGSMTPLDIKIKIVDAKGDE